jgi:hypothetical protein
VVRLWQWLRYAPCVLAGRMHCSKQPGLVLCWRRSCLAVTVRSVVCFLAGCAHVLFSAVCLAGVIKQSSWHEFLMRRLWLWLGYTGWVSQPAPTCLSCGPTFVCWSGAARVLPFPSLCECRCAC